MTFRTPIISLLLLTLGLSAHADSSRFEDRPIVGIASGTRTTECERLEDRFSQELCEAGPIENPVFINDDTHMSCFIDMYEDRKRRGVSYGSNINNKGFLRFGRFHRTLATVRRGRSKITLGYHSTKILVHTKVKGRKKVETVYSGFTTLSDSSIEKVAYVKKRGKWIPKKALLVEISGIGSKVVETRYKKFDKKKNRFKKKGKTKITDGSYQGVSHSGDYRRTYKRLASLVITATLAREGCKVVYPHIKSK